MQNYYTKPVFPFSLFGGLFTKYGVENGEVFKRTAIFGFKIGKMISIPLQNISRKEVNGNQIFGSVSFDDVSNNPVIWSKVWFPYKKLRIVNDMIALQSSVINGKD